LLECCVLRHTRLAGLSSRCAIAAAVVDLFIWQRQASSIAAPAAVAAAAAAAAAGSVG